MFGGMGAAVSCAACAASVAASTTMLAAVSAGNSYRYCNEHRYDSNGDLRPDAVLSNDSE